tara:strand:+ start:429 stop:752 length:324 start_codon:yes stop_codon:yes gene_type:complete
MKKNIKINNISEGKAVNIIRKPILTEKSTNLNQFNQYSFVVNLKSNSIEIKEAIEKIFKVKVSKINTCIVRGKRKNFKGSFGYKKDYKKAIVTLKEGQTIDSSLEIK